MAHPDPYDFATDGTFTNPGQPSDGQSNKLDPAASGLDTRGWNPSEMPNVRHHNWLFNLIGLWLAWLAARLDSNDDWNYETAKTGVLSISPLNGTSADASGAVDWRAVSKNAVASKQNSGVWFLDITPFLPDGCSFVTVSARVSPGTARATVADRVQMALWEVDNVASPPTETQLGSTQSDDGSVTANQVLSVSGLGGGSGIVVDKLSDRHSYVLRFKSGNNAASFQDKLYQINVSISIPGPRAL